MADCIDLSTCISPYSWPVTEISSSLWRELPHSNDSESLLLQAGSRYYGCGQEELLVVPGSQSAIQLIPELLDGVTAIPRIGYEEYRYCWQLANKNSISYRNLDELKQLVAQGQIQNAVVINPNNPTTTTYDSKELLDIANSLADVDGYLLIDEAFADAQPELSLCSRVDGGGLIVLRSIGKFFGMAGMRLGFVVAQQALLHKLRTRLGLWPVGSAVLWLGGQILSDRQWIENQRCLLKKESESLFRQVNSLFPELSWRKANLFVSGKGSVEQVDRYLAELADIAVLARKIPLSINQALLRLGIPNEIGKHRLSELRP